MPSTRLPTALGIFAAGAACGAAAVLFGLRQPPAPALPPQPAAPAAAPDLPALAPRGAAAVTVTFRRGNDDVRRRGTLLADQRLVLIAIEPFGRYDSGFWNDARGVRQPLGPAVAWDFDIGLAAFAVSGEVQGARLAPDDGSLFVGLDIELADGASVQRAAVATTATRTHAGHYTYGIAANGQAIAGSPLLLPGERTLAGIVIGPASGDATYVAQAVDAGAVRDLLELGARRTAVSVSQLSIEWGQSQHGLRAGLDAALNAQRWSDAVEIAATLRERYPELVDESLNAAALRAIAELSTQRLSGGQPDAALTLLENALLDWTPTPEFLLLVARAQVQTNQLAAAIATLRDARSAAHNTPLDELLRDEQRQLIERVADRPAVSASEAIELLRDAVDSDDYAGYHRALGLRLFDAGNYGAAVYHLQRAIELQPALASQLRYALEQSLQRRSTAGLIEVPLENAGNSLFVNVHLNNSRESFRFLLDTGASYSAVNTRTVLRLGLNDIFANGATPIRLETAGGPVYAGSFTMERVDVAGAVVHDVPVVILEDMNSVDGLLGLSFLNHFGVQINAREGKLLLTPR